MQRTQIYLDKKAIRLLARLASKTGKTRSELIREAIGEVYMQDDVKQALSQIEGLKSFANVKAESKSTYRSQRQWS